MNQFFEKIEQMAQVLAACFVLVLGVHVGKAVISGQSAIAEPEPAARVLVAPALPAPAQIREAALRPVPEPYGPQDDQPVLVTALPGEAMVFARPDALMQVQVESGSSICTRTLAIGDPQGAMRLPVAATRNCATPRVVVVH